MFFMEGQSMLDKQILNLCSEKLVALIVAGMKLTLMM